MSGLKTSELMGVITSLKNAMTLSTIYVLSDAFYDYGLVKLPSPWSEVMYYGRYAAVIFCYILKLYKNRQQMKATAPSG